MTRSVARPSDNAPANQIEPHIDMTFQEVRARWGAPTDISQEEGVQGRIDTWSYGDARSVQFDSRGLVRVPW
jgi:hypothetical protein